MNRDKLNSTLNRIQQLCSEREWSIYRLANESGLAYSSLNNMFLRNTQPISVRDLKYH